MKVVKVLNYDINVSNNIENPIIPIRSMISNAEKAEKLLPLNYDYTRLVKLNVYCYNSFPNE